MRDRALRRGHVLGDAAAHADDLDRLVLARAAGVRGVIALARAVAQEGVEIGVADAVALGASPAPRSMPRSLARARTAGEARTWLVRAPSSSGAARGRSTERWVGRRRFGSCARQARPRERRFGTLRRRRDSPPRRSATLGLARARRLASLAVIGRDFGAPPPSPSVSITTSVEPIGTWSPTSPASSTTVPDTGDSISTVALSVIMSAMRWSSSTRSPTLTCQATISASAMPSPISGRLEFEAGHRQSFMSFLSASPMRTGPGK